MVYPRAISVVRWQNQLKKLGGDDHEFIVVNQTFVVQPVGLMFSELSGLTVVVTMWRFMMASGG